MKFEDIKPNADSKDEISFEGSLLFRSPIKARCWHCREFTHWIDINFEAYLCSEECERAKWQEFKEAFNASTEKNRPPV